MVRAIDWGDSVHQLCFNSPALTDSLPATAAVVQEGGLKCQAQASSLIWRAVREEGTHGILCTHLASCHLKDVWSPEGLRLIIAQHHSCILNGGFNFCGRGLETIHPLQQDTAASGIFAEML